MDVCRICRGEASANQPLLHPCKCRGSIRYIHQECLLEWLKHLNKLTEKCDICDTPYRFETIYDPEMPLTIPVRFLAEKFIRILYSAVNQAMSLLLYVLCLPIQVPCFWQIVLRLYTYVVDGGVPNGLPLLDYLVFGGVYQGWSAKAISFMRFTYLSGLCWLVVLFIIHFALFIEHEWITRDEGFHRLLTKVLGKEPRTQLIDMVQQALEAARRNPMQDDQRAPNTPGTELGRDAASFARMATILQEFDGDLPDSNHQERLRDSLEHQRLAAHARAQQEDTEENLQDIGPHVEVGDDNDDGHEEAMHQNNNALDANAVENDNAGVFNELDRNFAPAEFEEEEDDELAPANDVAEFLELFGLALDLKTPIMAMGFCDIIIVVYLLVAYLVPHVVGMVVTELVRMISTFCATLVSNSTKSLNCEYLSLIHRTHADYIALCARLPTNSVIAVALHDISKNLRSYGVDTFYHVFVDPPQHLLVLERILIVFVGYTFIVGTIAHFMRLLIGNRKPVVGSARKVYAVLFEAVITFKVFLIFCIEIFVFPVYCGWLLDFCAVPLLLDEVYHSANLRISWLATNGFELSRHPLIRTGIYWFAGTLYMLFFALYVGMVRGKILRPGVLCFLRLPDDPNARLIHDAVVRPLGLQLQRIYQAAKVYTLFIVFGIGAITWGLRLVVREDTPKFLPIQWPGIILFSAAIALGFHLLQPAFQECFRRWNYWYWSRAFSQACHKMRLSHFILGKPVALERGHVVYRLLAAWFSGAKPDFSRPMTYSESQAEFRNNTDAHACFVPDGSYVRAPDNDLVLRRFLKKLFCKVTKDDKLLAPAPQIEEDDGYYTSEDEGLIAEDCYDIVYSPPNFRLRWVTLIVILWLFGVVLVLLVVMVAFALGRPVVRVSHMVIEHFLLSYAPEFDWRLADLGSLVVGLALEAIYLKWYDSSYRHHPVPEADVPLDAFNNQGDMEDAERGDQADLENRHWLSMLLLAFFLVTGLMPFVWFFWIVSVHVLCIDQPLRVYLTLPPITSYSQLFEVLGDQQALQLYLTPTLVALHLMTMLFTILPCVMQVNQIPAKIRARMGPEDAPWRDVFVGTGLFDAFANILMIHAPALFFLMFFKYQGEFSKSVYTWAFSLIIYITTKLTLRLTRFYFAITQLVRDEKYVRGRAIRNID